MRTGLPERRTQRLLVTNNEVGLEESEKKTKHTLMSRHRKGGKKTKHTLMSRHRKGGHSHSTKTAIAPFRIWQKERHKRIKLHIHEEILSRLNLGKACCRSVQNLSFLLLYENVKIKTYVTTLLFVVSYGRETRFVILREEPSLP
jgi:hypothetical protein